MQRILLVLFWVMGLGVAQGQHSEFSVQAGSGLFSFRGSGAVSQTGILLMAPGVMSPYGRHSGLSYGLTGQWQQTSRSGLVLGVQAGYESLTSRAAILYVNGDFTSNPANGNVRLRNQYVNLHPFVGKRFGTIRGGLDLTAGVDLAYGVASTGSILLDSDNTPGGYITAVDYNMPTVDVRPRVNLTGYYRSFGLNVGYSLGALSYTPSSRSDATQVYSQYWRAGISYRFGRRG
ncbi:hypothetical protein [Spirosoma rhododendri]|uniref:Outer membrane protein beta-barrel domain-containing protein n=1 Tax=Spirosoma rhododendri TaxID=2728024 RepID=A0A7L5DKX9_9BACT|nr:hypothetical protein [Spirosoma rhododendri]QJD77058.1 hypothetical protein HH216_00485 [Spirosoma rhododendri]